MVQMFGILGRPLGLVMQLIYNLVNDYGITIILFTILVRLAMLPLAFKQQKSTARMSAFQPMIQEIQKKWPNDKQRAQAEVQKFYEENDLKMTAGCAPMLVNMVVLFGIIAVIQAPMQYMLNIDKVEVERAVAIVNAYQPDTITQNDGYTRESVLIDYFKTHPDWFTQGKEIDVADLPEEVAKSPISGVTANSASSGAASGSGASASQAQASSASQTEAAPQGKVLVEVNPDTIKRVNEFKFEFLGLNLSHKPTTKDIGSLVLPILSILTMFASQFIVMKTGGAGAQSNRQMMIMTIAMGAMFGYFAFTIPAGFSLYYTASNVVMTLQQLIVRRVHDPEKIKEEVMREIEERKKAKKAKKKVTIKDASGKTVTKELSANELNKARLAKARELDAQKYADTEEEKEKAEQAAEKARALDEEKYGKNGDKANNAAREADPQNEAADEAAPEEKEKNQNGRRKRARENKKNSQLGLSPSMQDEEPKEEE